MNFIEFQTAYKDQPILYSRDLIRSGRHPQQVRNQLGRWLAKDYLLKLKKGVYTLKGSAPDSNWLANSLYEPSYISLEYALNFYGLIPERVADVTSITTLKTKTFRNEIGNFVYRHIKPPVFRGFVQARSGRLSYFIAEPEKALVDFLYLNLPLFKQTGIDSVLKESLRLQNVEALDPLKLRLWAKLFDNVKLTRVIGAVYRIVSEES